MHSLTLEEELAIAVLRGDEDAKKAIIDRYLAIRDGTEIEETITTVSQTIHDGYFLYHTPEFIRLMEVIGFNWQQRVIGVTLHVYRGRRVEIVARIAGSVEVPVLDNHVTAEELTIPEVSDEPANP